MEHENVCFVVMPFGRRAVDGAQIDFDQIYEKVLKPAIEMAPRPEGGRLEARRTDRDFFTGDISQEMYQYLEYSRLVVADITSLNPNVFYELGARHRARESGTVILRQQGTSLPFDIRMVKAFPYEYQPEANAEESRQLITRVVGESLQQVRLDSPIQAVIQLHRARSGQAEALSRVAENEIRRLDPIAAIETLRTLLRRPDATPLDRMKLGLLLKGQGLWPEARQVFVAVTQALPEYPEGWRERGIAENKITRTGSADSTGETALRRALELNPADFDAHASLGGVLKRAGRLSEALPHYVAASELSNHHPYPLLNMLKLRASIAGELELTGVDRRALGRARRLRVGQSDHAQDQPWSHFDASQLGLIEGDLADAVARLDRGVATATAEWQVQTFRESLELLEAMREPLAGAAALLARLD